jgi:hypothetical protein
VRIEELVAKQFPLEWKGSSRRWMVPEGGEPSSLVVDTKWQIAHWYAKDFCGGAYLWALHFGGLSEEEAKELITVREKQSPVRILRRIPMANAIRWHVSITGHARRYLHDRGITDAAIDHFILGSCYLHGESITIPHFGSVGLTGIKLRVMEADKQGRYRSIPGSSFSLYNASERSRIIVEGEFKAIHMWQIGIPAMSLPAGGFTEHIVDQLKGKDLIFVRDNDRAGFSAAWRAKTIMPGLKVISTPSEKAIDDYLLKEGITKWVRMSFG